MVNPRISAIAAFSENNVIGVGGRLPWHIPADFKLEDFTLEGYDPHPAIKADIANIGGL